MTPWFAGTRLLAVTAVLLSGCGQPWQPLTTCPDSAHVSGVMGVAGLELLDTSATGDPTGDATDLIICNYDVPAAESELFVVPRVSIVQFRGEVLQRFSEFEQSNEWYRRAIDAPVEGADAHVSANRSVGLQYEFDDGRVSLQYVQPPSEPPFSDSDAALRVAELAQLAGLPLD